MVVPKRRFTFTFAFEDNSLLPATFWLQFYVDDGLQGGAHWLINGIQIYGIIH
jgi:hypothetical protein